MKPSMSAKRMLGKREREKKKKKKASQNLLLIFLQVLGYAEACRGVPDLKKQGDKHP